MDLAALDIIIGAKIETAINNVDKLNKTFDNTTTSTTRTAAVLDTVTRNLAKTTSAAAATSGGVKAIGDVSLKTADSVSRIPKSFDEVSQSVNDLESQFNAKWNAIIATAEKLAQPLSETAAQMAKLQEQVSSFGGGVLSFKAVGADQVLLQSKLIVDVVNSIPVQKVISFAISANTQAALAGISGLSAEIDDLASGGTVSIAKIITALSQLQAATIGATSINDVQKYDAAIQALSADLSKIQNTTKAATSGVSSFGKSAGTSFSKTASVSNSATLALGNLGRVAQDLPYGFIGISNNLNPLLESFQRLGVEAKLAGVSIGSTLIKSLTGAGGLNLALSIATAAFSFASIGMNLWTRGMGSSKKAVDDATQSNEDYEKSLKSIGDSAIKDAEKQISSLTSLTQTVKDNAASLTARLDAAGKLQEQSGYFAALSKEQILYGNITDAINKSTQAILNKAYADAAIGKATEAANKFFGLQTELNGLIPRLTAAQQAYNIALKESQSGFGTGELDKAKQNYNNLKESVDKIRNALLEADLEQRTFISQSSKYSAMADNVDKAAIVIAKLNNQIDDLNKKSSATGADFKTEKISAYKKAVEDLLALPNITASDKRVQDLISKINALGGSFEEAAKHAAKSKATISSVLADLNKDISALTDIEINLNVNKSAEKINAILATIKKLETDFNVPSDSTIIAKLFGQISDIKFSPANFKDFINKISIPAERVPFEIQIEPIVTSLQDFNKIIERKVLENTGRLFKNAQGITVPVKLLNDYEVDANYDDLKTKLEDQAKQISDIAGTAISDTLSMMAEGIGSIIAGGENIFGGIFEILGHGLQALGKYLISSSALIGNIKNAIDAALKIPGGQALGIALGVALEVLGSVILAKAPKLAEGGIIPPGYANDSYVARLSSQEAVIPLNKISQFFTNESRVEVFIPEHRISGNDIVISYNRTTRQNKRTY